MDLSYTRCIDFSGREYTVPTTVKKEGSVTYVTIKKENYKAAYQVDILPQIAESPVDEGYYVLPEFLSGTLVYLQDEIEYTKDCLPSVSFYGVKRKDRVVSVIIEGMRYEASIRHSFKGGVHEAFFILRLGEEKIDAYEDITLIVTEHPLSADYNEMAENYRNYKYSNGLKSIKEKGLKAVDYASEAMEIRVRMGWKPVPAEIEYQTEETEPEMHVAVTFDKLIRLMDSMHEKGVEKAEFCLVGWNKSGHDGRWPQIFPVEERLGGEEGLKKAIRHAQELGYQIVAHTNSSDAYTVADCFDGDQMVCDRDGEVEKGTTWGGGRLHKLCAVNAIEMTREALPRVRQLGFSGVHYIDVLSVVRPYYCYHKKHPATRKDTALLWREMLKLSREIFGGCASEGSYDMIAEDIDFVLYCGFNKFTRLKQNYRFKIIPLWELVYHGAVMACPSSELVNVGIIDKQLQLKFIEFGGRPAMYIHSRFVKESQERGNWMGEDDLYLNDEAQMMRTVDVLKATEEFYKPLKKLQKEKMVKHQQLNDEVVRVTYENGTSIYINYGKTEARLEGVTVNAEDYLIKEI